MKKFSDENLKNIVDIILWSTVLAAIYVIDYFMN